MLSRRARQGPTSPNLPLGPHLHRDYRSFKQSSNRCRSLSHYLASRNFLMCAHHDIRSLLGLDDDIVIEIFKFLDVASILVLRKVMHTTTSRNIACIATEPLCRHVGGCFWYLVLQ